MLPLLLRRGGGGGHVSLFVWIKWKILCLLCTKRRSACSSILLLLLAFFQRARNNECAPPSQSFSPLNLSYIAFIMPQRKSTYYARPSARSSFCLNFCAVSSLLQEGGFFTRGAALNSALKKRNHRKEIYAHISITYIFAVGSERTNAHLNVKMGFANVWGSHPKDNAKGGRAWYVGDVLFPNSMMREIFYSRLCLFFLLCGCRDPIDERGWRRDDEPKARRICANGVRSEKMRVDIVSIRFRNRRDDRLAVYNEGPSFRTLRALIDFSSFFPLCFFLWWTRLTFLLFLCYY